MNTPGNHFEQLEQLLEEESRAEIERFDVLHASVPLGEREESGLAIGDLEASDERWGLNGRLLVHFGRAGREDMPSAFEPGALVHLMPRRSPDTHPARAVVVRRTFSELVLAFDTPPPEFVQHGRVLAQLAANDVTYRRAQHALRTLAEPGAAGQQRHRDLLLGRTAPRISQPASFEASIPLSSRQHEAVARALGAKDVFLVHGPPGTGKSTVLTETARQAVRRGETVLATAPSNAAVDHLLAACLKAGLRAVRVGHPARVSDALHAHTLEQRTEQHPSYAIARDLFDDAAELSGYARKQRRQGRSRERFAQARDAKRQANALRKEAREHERRAIAQVLDEADVVCTTLASIGARPLETRRFDVALVDEATQAIEPLTLWAFLKAPRVVLAGDHKQLPPTVLSQRAERGGLGKSLFERLLDEHGDAVKCMLTLQHRMHTQIMGFPSQSMYASALQAHATVATRDLQQIYPAAAAIDAPPVLFLDTAGAGLHETREETSQSHYNTGEAELLVARVEALLAHGICGSDMGVILPYNAQKQRVRELFGHRGIGMDVEVDTVDAFQGREKAVILVGFTRSNEAGQLGFLRELRRTNVALTRAKAHLFMVGDSATLSALDYYRQLIDYCEAVAGYRTVWDWT